MPHKSRTYRPIWDHLRKHHKCVLSVVDAGFVPRIKRMISKEKDEDIGFKLLNQVERLYLQFSFDPEAMELTIVLRGRFGIVDIVG